MEDMGDTCAFKNLQRVGKLSSQLSGKMQILAPWWKTCKPSYFWGRRTNKNSRSFSSLQTLQNDRLWHYILTPNPHTILHKQTRCNSQLCQIPFWESCDANLDREKVLCIFQQQQQWLWEHFAGLGRVHKVQKIGFSGSFLLCLVILFSLFTE